MLLLGIGLVIGLMLGLTGAGGSVFAVPLLILLAKLPMNSAVAISLAAVAASTLYGSLHNWRKQQILWTPGFILAGTGALFSPLGNWLGLKVPEVVLLIGFSLLASVIALRMWLTATHNPESAKMVRASHFDVTSSPGLVCNLSGTGQFELRPRCLLGLLLGGATVGVLSGLFGVGGGFLIVPLLLRLAPLTMAQAVSTSIVIIAAVSCAGFFSHLLISPLQAWGVLAQVAVGGVLGMLLGQRISHKIANALLQKVFAVSLVVLSLVTVLRYL